MEPKKIDEVASGVLREEEQVQTSSPDYSPEEQKYLSGLKARLTAAAAARDTNHEAFDGMTYAERCKQNRRLANTYIKPRDNRLETSFSTGTTRKKLFTFLASLVNLNLLPDITAYDEENIAQAEIGEALEDILEKEDELDNGEEKRYVREFTLISQGEVFVRILWKKSQYLKKTISNFVQGKFRNVTINKKLRQALGKMTTDVIKNEKVYLGNIREYYMENQPFVFFAEVIDYDDAELMFGDFEMWKYVNRDMTEFMNTTAGVDNDAYSWTWTIGPYQKGKVEVVYYESKPMNEIQVLLNGIPMLPIGYPLEEVSPDCEYTIVKQTFEIIDPDFAYGRSLPQTLKTSQALEDEFWRIALLEGQQTALPPMINNTGKVLSSKIFMPAVITQNIPEGKLKPLLEGKSGPGSSEIQVLQLLRSNMDENSSDPQVSGQNPSGNPTATQISIVQQQAERMLGLSILSSSLLEKKITERKIPYALKYWFDPVDQKIDKVRDALVDVYRSISVEKPIEGRGMGNEIVKVVDNSYFNGRKKSEIEMELMNEENRVSRETGVPMRKILVNRDKILSSKFLWRVVIIPKPKKTSNLQKLLFQDEVNLYALSPNFNMEWFEENAAIIHGRNPQKVFRRNQAQTGPIAPPGGSGVSAATAVNGATKKPSALAMNGGNVS